MDTGSFLIECAVFTAKFCASCYLYKLYKRNAECLKALKEAQYFEIDSKLQNEVEKNGGIIEYAVVSGTIKRSKTIPFIKRLSLPIRSQYVPHLQGVIREKLARSKIHWNPCLGRSAYAMNHLIHNVPFALCNKTTGLFKREMRVEVLEPLTAEELVLPVVYDKIKPHHDTFNDAVAGFIHGQRGVGIREMERMLCEGETLTAVGKLIIENNQLMVKQPANDFKYFLTHLSIESLINKVHSSMRRSKIQFIIMGALTFTLFLCISRHAFLIIKRKIIRNRERINNMRNTENQEE